MDSETTRLIITASAAVVAGLGGASLTSVINRKNTIDTLATSRLVAHEQAKQTQDREHTQWIRDQKLEAYTEFLTAAESLLHELGTQPHLEKPHVSLLELQTRRGKVRVVGSPEAREAARDINSHLHGHLREQRKLAKWVSKNPPASRTADQIAERDEMISALQKARFEIAALHVDFVSVIRRDLGAATVDDAAIDERNKQIFAARERKLTTAPDDRVIDAGS